MMNRKIINDVKLDMQKIKFDEFKIDALFDSKSWFISSLEAC